MFKKKQLFKAWYREIKNKQDYKNKIYKAKSHYLRSILKGIRNGCIALQKEREMHIEYQAQCINLISKKSNNELLRT